MILRVVFYRVVNLEEAGARGDFGPAAVLVFNQIVAAVSQGAGDRPGHNIVIIAKIAGRSRGFSTAVFSIYRQC